MKRTLIVCGCVLAVSWPLVAADEERLEMSATEKMLVDLTNAERQKKDLAPLRPSPVLFQVARTHARNMAKQGKMEHVLDGKNPVDRLREAGYRFLAMGENIARNPENIAPDAIMKMWMDSKIHRENMLNKEVTEIGMGIAPDGKGQLFYVQVLGKPR